jgi:hypothetical protein
LYLIFFVSLFIYHLSLFLFFFFSSLFVWPHITNVSTIDVILTTEHIQISKSHHVHRYSHIIRL